ncbi:MAG: HAD-IIIC family phosphatase [Bacteroides sp.]|nr:HAD-IIIC family phosphatase [Bacteroides sp.]
MFIFRNYTIENLFDENVRFSGYGDISEIPQSDVYVWFYNAPIGTDHTSIVDEITGIGDKLKIAAAKIPSSSPFYILTLENLFPTHISLADNSVADAITQVNLTAYDLGTTHSNIRIIDFSEFLQQYKPQEWINWKFYFLSQMVINPSIAGEFKNWWQKKLSALTTPRKKCLVLDLDNTLWSGVLGEDGIAGIKMSGDYPGNAFAYFQKSLLTLAHNGVILTVCSKNNEEDVKELWDKNPFLNIGPKDIAAYRINWNNKADNIREIAQELNIGMDSMVFIDDNPTERELIRKELPMVTVPEFPKRPYDLMKFYKILLDSYFQTYRLTNEDKHKTEQYKANALRATEKSRFTDLTDFIKNLDIRIDFLKADEFTVPRIAQMTQKTNQFNLTTHRYSEADINAFLEHKDSVYCISVSDKFGDSGITGAAIITRCGEIAEIDTFLLSCRILGKNIEIVFIKILLNMLIKDGVKEVTAKYIPTSKNRQVVTFYDSIGFRLSDEKDGVKEYQLTINTPFTIPEYYTISLK